MSDFDRYSDDDLRDMADSGHVSRETVDAELDARNPVETPLAVSSVTEPVVSSAEPSVTGEPGAEPTA